MTDAWTEIANTRDLTVFAKFERGFRHLQRIAEQRTGTKLLFGRALLRTVFRTYEETVVTELLGEGRTARLSSLPVRMPPVLAGTLLGSFDRHCFGREEGRDPDRINLGRATLDAGGYFILAFCVESYLFLAYKRLGHDYMPGLDPRDVALVEHILDEVDARPEGSPTTRSYTRIFQRIGEALAFDPG